MKSYKANFNTSQKGFQKTLKQSFKNYMSLYEIQFVVPLKEYKEYSLTCHSAILVNKAYAFL